MRFYEQSGIVTRISKLNETVYDFSVNCPDIALAAKPGQFVNVSVPGFFLRRPISVCEADGANLRLVFEVRGEGTKALAGTKTGDAVDILGPLGAHGFSTDKYTSAILVGGGIGTPPLKYVQNKLEKSMTILGFNSVDKVIMSDEFSDVFICTVDGSLGFEGNIYHPLEEALQTGGYEVVFACGPLPMLKTVVDLSCEYGIPCEVSLEERMACGVGACLGCVCKTETRGETLYPHVCKNGPVFDGEAVSFA
jgi:dihydroorotate dehydrogenase electron transfer subunit